MTEKQKKQYKMLQEKANIKYIGKKYGRLTVLEYVRTAKKYKYFLCICDCGTKKEVEIKHLVSGATRSARINKLKWSVTRALTEPINKNNRHRALT